MKKTIYLLVFFFIAVSTSKAEGDSLPVNPPKAELEITLERGSKPNTFHLSAKGCGPSSTRIVRPRVHMVDYLGSWGGWSLRVQGPGGVFQPFPFPAGIQPFTSLDVVDLRLGESVGVVLNLSKYTRDGKSLLADLPGKYTVVVVYHLEQDKVVSVHGTQHGEDFVSMPKLPAMESAALQFVVLAEGKQDETRQSPNKVLQRTGCAGR